MQYLFSIYYLRFTIVGLHSSILPAETWTDKILKAA